MPTTNSFLQFGNNLNKKSLSIIGYKLLVSITLNSCLQFGANLSEELLSKLTSTKVIMVDFKSKVI